MLLTLLSLILCLVLVGTRLHAQELPSPTFLFGPRIELGLGFDIASVPVFGGDPRCGLFTTGTALLPGAGGTMLLPELFAPSVGLGVDVMVHCAMGTLRARPVDPQRLYEPGSGGLVELDEHYELEGSWWNVSVRPALTVVLSERASLLAGTLLGYRLGTGFAATDHIEGPGDYRFADGSSVRALEGATLLVPSPIEVGGTLGVALDFRLGERTILQPRLAVTWIAASPVEVYGWSRLGVTLGAALLFAPKPEAPPALPPRLPAAPVARLEINGVDQNGVQIPVPEVIVEESIYRRHAPLLPALFFDRASATIPGRYHSTDTLPTREHRIAERSLLALQRQLPAIVARRMKERPASRLLLAGSISGGEEQGLAAERAVGVRQYLATTFGVDAGHVTTATGNPVLKRSNEMSEQGREDNRRVELRSTDPAILAPVVVEWGERTFSPPAIVVEPHFSAEAGVKHWEVSVTQGGREVARFGETGGNEGAFDPEFTWRIVDDRIDSALAPLVAVLRVVDSNDVEAVDTVTTVLRLRQQRSVHNADVERHDERERIEWTLIGFDFNEATLKKEALQTIEEIATMVRPGATITITGTTDTIGRSMVNAELALRRSRTAASLLQQQLEQRRVSEARIVVAGVGEETARFGDEWPEARLLSRGVQIILEQNAAK